SRSPGAEADGRCHQLCPATPACRAWYCVRCGRGGRRPDETRLMAIASSESPPRGESGPGLGERASSLLAALGDSARRGREMASGACHLAALEAQLAALSLVQMVAFAIAAALVGFSAWGLIL